ncbi:hypothetical protein QVD17_09402 [Tagetes erecta]|uniref:Uncharacterized protein n=1 Tax=Tagetes erecta TaxID=13708 RepID=A0AAD8L795_TARER|nr:hypothetical protein QVD17_09402 [Tagetes erecta]
MLIFPKSSHRREGLAPRCRLFATWGCSMFQGLGYSPNPEQTVGDKPEEGEDDVKSSCPLCPGRHTCYNGRDKGSRSREGELTPKTRPQFGLQAATRQNEAGIASNRRSVIRR